LPSSYCGLLVRRRMVLICVPVR